LEEFSEERTAVYDHRFLDPGKHTGIHAFRVVGRPEQVRRHTRDDPGFAHILGAVFSEPCSGKKERSSKCIRSDLTQLLSVSETAYVALDAEGTAGWIELD